MINTVVDNGTIRLGLVNDNKATVIQFPVANYFSLFGEGGQFILLNKRPEDATAYAVPAEYVSVSDNILNWTLTNYDVAQPGNGECQLSYYLGDVCKMSQRWRTAVGASLVSTGIVPEPMQTWLDELAEYVERAEDAAEAAEEATTKMPYIGENGDWYIWDAVNEQWVDSETSARPLFVVVGSLPAEGQSGIIYLVPKQDPQSGDTYDEYIWLNGGYELIGTTAIDLSGYVPKTWLDGTSPVDGDLSMRTNAGNNATLSASVDENEDGGNINVSGEGGVRVQSGLGDATIYAGGNVQLDADFNVRVSAVDTVALNGEHVTANGREVLTEQDDTGVPENAAFNERSLPAQPFKFKKVNNYIGGTVAWNQLVKPDDISVTLPNGRKYVAYIGGAWSVGTSSGTALAVDADAGDMVFDLTLMLGATVANYIVGLGNTNGVAYFRALFGADNYQYCVGALYSSCPLTARAWKGADGSSYDLGHPTLSGLFKLDGNNRLYCDGDTYEHDGTVTRKYARVNLGDLTWNTTTSASLGQYYYAAASTLGIKYLGNYGLTLYPAINPRYMQVKRVAASFVDKTITFDGSVGNVTQIQIKDSDYADAATLKTSLNGVYLVYELATPTTETADAYAEKQTVYSGGYEEITDYVQEQGLRDVAVPVGQDATYYREMILVPAPPLTNGTYTLSATVSGGVPTFTWS